MRHAAEAAQKSLQPLISMLGPRAAAITRSAAEFASACLTFLWTHLRYYLFRTKRYRLIYYDGRGQVEIVRLIFALGQMLPGRDYENVKLPITYIGPRQTDYDCPEFSKMQAEGRLVCNLDRVPVLEEVGGDFAVGQSPAIARYVARELNLMGRSEAEAASVDAVVEHVRDIRHAFATFRGSNSWFGEIDGHQPSVGRSSDSCVRERRNLRWWLRQLDKCVGDDGFAIGGRPSIADVSLYYCFGDVCEELQGGPYESGAEPFGDLSATRRALHAESPRVARIVERFPALPGVREYLEGREPQVF